MRAVTLKVAKARLNEIVDAATRGEQVVLMKGARHGAAIVPLSAEELELPPRLTDAQAERLWQSLAEEQRKGRVRRFPSAEEAVTYLQKPARRRAKARRVHADPGGHPRRDPALLARALRSVARVRGPF